MIQMPPLVPSGFAAPAAPVGEISRLSPQAYQSLLKVLPGPALPKTDLEAGYLLGIQRVLQSLREGFVIGL